MHKFFLIAAVGALGILGCERTTSDNKPPVTTPGAPGTGTVISTNAEIACAHCQYKAPGVTACAPGVKIDGKTYVLEGSTVDVMKEGLCTATKQATVEGRIDGGKFIASKVEVKR